MPSHYTGAMTTLAATLHDPDGRLADALATHSALLRGYAGVHVCATRATARPVLELLDQTGARLVTRRAGAIGESRRAALRSARAAGATSILSCDLDRWLHWAGRFPDELRALPERLAARRPALWYACVGRTARAYRTHPRVQQVSERLANDVLSAALGRRLDATAGCCWLSDAGADLVLAHSTAASNATDLEWPAIVARAHPRRLGSARVEGLEFETLTFYAADLPTDAARRAWLRAHYETPVAWQTRLQLSVDSIAAMRAVWEQPE